MNPYTLPIALVAFLSFAVIMPVMFYFLNTHAPGLPAEVQFLAYLVPIALVALYIAGWVQPGGA